MIFTQCHIIKWSTTNEKQHSGHTRKSNQLFIPYLRECSYGNMNLSVRNYETKIDHEKQITNSSKLFFRLYINQILSVKNGLKFKGEFPLSHNFYALSQVKFTEGINKLEAMYERPRVNVKVERRLTFTFTRDLPYIASNLFTHVIFTRVRTY